MANTNPAYGQGKICYVELPAINAEVSAAFYRKVFNWTTRLNNEGQLSFDDGVNQVSGTWRTDRLPAKEPTLIVHIMVDNAAKTVLDIIENGGSIVQKIGKDFPEITALFADPAGNVLGIYQHRE